MFNRKTVKQFSLFQPYHKILIKYYLLFYNYKFNSYYISMIRQLHHRNHTQDKPNILATVSINLGQNKQNPTLTITKNTNIPKLVRELTNKYGLPEKAYDLIISKVNQQLEKVGVKQNQPAKQPLKNVSKQLSKVSIEAKPKRVQQLSLNEKKKSVSLNKQKTPLSPNVKQKSIKLQSKKSKISIQANKENSQSNHLMNVNVHKKEHQQNHILKLFSLLTKYNPQHVKILTPQYISFQNMNSALLQALQDFFCDLQEEEFEGMTAQEFCKKVDQYGYMLMFEKIMMHL